MTDWEERHRERTLTNPCEEYKLNVKTGDDLRAKEMIQKKKENGS